MELECQLVHAEPGQRVVLVRAQRNGQPLGSALGEAATAEEAEERAIQRLLARLNQPTAVAQPKPVAPSSSKVQSTPQGQSTPQAPSATERPIPAEQQPAPDHQPALEFQPAPSPRAKAPAPTKIADEPVTEPSLPAIPASASSIAASTGTSAKPAELPPRPATAEAAPAPAEDPEDWSSELARLDLQLQRLGWSRDQEGLYLERAFGHPSRNRLTHYGDLLAYLTMLESLAPGADPGSASVPLRRRDLLAQCDQLLGQLQWDASTGRAFLEQHFSLTSRQQLSDSQLLQFNMLLEGELMGL